MSNLEKVYKKSVISSLKKEHNIGNVHDVPKIKKIVLNVGAGEAVQNHKTLEFIQKDIQLISGQKPILTKAKKSIASFKLREGMSIGCKVTLRRKRMYEFLERLIYVALPRTRDFKGVSPKAFDGKGNYSLGIQEQLIFPEIQFDKTDKVRGFNVSIVTTAKTNEQAKSLLKGLGMPFREK